MLSLKYLDIKYIKMQSFPFLYIVAVILITSNVQGLEDLIGTSIQHCLNCMCHARSGCWSRFNCARYSIDKNYWERAGRHSTISDSDANEAYKACMKNENCILNTLKSYTEQFGEFDCNCDGLFDCKDRLAIHLFGEECRNPAFGHVYARRFNDCAKQIGVTLMSSKEEGCDAIKEVDAV